METTTKLNDEELEITTEVKRVETKTRLLERKACCQNMIVEIDALLDKFK